MASAAEARLRDLAVAFLRRMEPQARIIHELPLSGFSAAGRCDLAAVTPTSITLVELKSEKDKMDRLPKQVAAMKAITPRVLVFCHEKHKPHFDPGKYVRPAAPDKDGCYRYDLVGRGVCHDVKYLARLCWETMGGEVEAIPPEPSVRDDWYSWGRHTCHRALIGVLHASELQDLARSRATMDRNTDIVLRRVPGQKIHAHVCSALLARRFAVADLPVSGADA